MWGLGQVMDGTVSVLNRKWGYHVIFGKGLPELGNAPVALSARPPPRRGLEALDGVIPVISRERKFIVVLDMRKDRADNFPRSPLHKI